MKKIVYDAVVIGGGASGCMCAVKLARRGKKIAIVDDNFKLAKKILVTGNGRCNITNMNMSSEYYNHNIDKWLSKFNCAETISFFNEIGLLTYVDNEGRVYPKTDTAKSVVDLINVEIEKYDIDVFLNQKVLNIDGNDIYSIKTDKQIYFAKNVVVAVGGKNKSLLDNFNIGFVSETPSLVALKTENTKILTGVRISNIEVKTSCENLSKKEKGEVLFKECGLSGIVIFNASTIFARLKKSSGVITLDLIPELNEDKFLKILMERKHIKTNILEGVFCHEMAIYIYERLHIDNCCADKLTNAQIKQIVCLCKNLDFNVCGFYNNNQVVSGGVSLNEVNEKLESKKYKGLYFIGEALDIDGECGGYNLQWAWTSGAIVGDSL